jgi:hypothetical protein
VILVYRAIIEKSHESLDIGDAPEANNSDRGIKDRLTSLIFYPRMKIVFVKMRVMIIGMEGFKILPISLFELSIERKATV